MSTLEHIVAPEEVMAYLDGELAPDRARAVHAHLSECTACQAVAAELRGVADHLLTWEVESAPATLRAPAVRAEHPTMAALAASWRASFRHAGAAALVVVAVGVAMWIATFGARQSLSPRQGFAGHKGVRGVAASGSGSGGGGVGDRATAPSPPRRGLAEPPGKAVPVAAQPQRGQKIIRTVTLAIVTKDFTAVRPAIDRVLAQVAGFVGTIQVSGDANSGSLEATLRVPAARLDEAVAALRQLGRVSDERQSGDDVTEQVRDLEARLTNSRNTEKRLTEVLRNRTGRVSDILEVEREIARVREEIERMDAERTNLERRVTYATISLHVSQERQATLDLGPLPISTKLRNAVVDGLRDAFESAIALVLWALRVVPTLVLWVAILWWPARFVLRRTRAWSVS